MRSILRLTPLLAGLCLGLPALAQQAPPPANTAPGCAEGSRAEAATPPARNGDGTAPGAAGSTGWSGGTGGSHIGTNTQGAVRESRTWQPPTARGLDPLAQDARARC
jgi:hypothetical protein